MRNKKLLIAFEGPAGSGKTAAANIAASNSYLTGTHRTQVLNFATPIKQAMAAMGFPEPEDRDLKEQLIPGQIFTWRDAAQKLGTEWGRSLDPDLWVKRAMAQADLTGLVIFGDCRFDNEAEAIYNAGGIVVRLKGRSASMSAGHGHASERGISDRYVAYTIDNSNSEEYLKDSITAILKEMERNKSAYDAEQAEMQAAYDAAEVLVDPTAQVMPGEAIIPAEAAELKAAVNSPGWTPDAPQETEEQEDDNG